MFWPSASQQQGKAPAGCQANILQQFLLHIDECIII